MILAKILLQGTSLITLQSVNSMVKGLMHGITNPTKWLQTDSLHVFTTCMGCVYIGKYPFLLYIELGVSIYVVYTYTLC